MGGRFHRGSATCCAVALWLSAAGSAAPAADGRQTLSFDRDWRFRFGDVTGAEQRVYCDTTWRRLDLPHDFSIEGPPGSHSALTMEGPFDRESPGGAAAGYLNGGVAWYRKSFTLPAGASEKRVYVLFDGVYMDSDVWINGVHLGKHPYGFTSFQYDLTPALTAATNLLAVRVNVKQPCSRWYSGAGIYRHVWLTIAEPVHVALWGTCVTTPEVQDQAARVCVSTRVQNQSAAPAGATLTTTLIGADGERVAEGQSPAQSIAAGAEAVFEQSLNVASPRRWSTSDPYLYRAVSEVRVGDRIVDRCETPFGIRTLRFTADDGFHLNGRRVQIKGVCMRQDLGCLGAAVNRRAIERRLEILKAMGCNAIHCAYDPPAPEFLDLCDRMGFLVMDGIFDEWQLPRHKRYPFGYSRFFDECSEQDLVSMLRRDRNHPSVILWSIGNDVREQAPPDGGPMATRLVALCHREDPTRPVTAGVTKMGRAVASGFVKALDVLGIDYLPGEYTAQRGQLLVASGTAAAMSSRGEYGLGTDNLEGGASARRIDNQCSSYDQDHRPGGSTAEASLLAIRNAPWVAGEFVWSGFDCLGDPGVFQWPSRSSYCGIMDLAGFPKDRFFLYQSQWSDAPVVHILPHWNWEVGQGRIVTVWCYSNAETVELFLNDRSLGVKVLAANGPLHLEWVVNYEPGVLKAVGRKGGQTVTDQRQTAYDPAALVVTPDRTRIAADGQDLAFFEVRVVDASGTLCPDANPEVSFDIQGPAELAGVDNGDPTAHEPFRELRIKAFHGMCLVVVKAGRSPGEVRLTATAAGLTAGMATVAVQMPQAPGE